MKEYPVRFEDRRTLVENREEILRRTQALRAELCMLWENQALTDEDRATFAHIDIHWAQIETLMRVSPGRIAEGPGAE